MSNNQDLEKIVGQLENSPGHILGLNGWLLRTIPKDKRTAFLKAFEKSVRVAYYPDHASDAKTRGTRERYIQAVSSAITYLTSDEFSFELAVEEVPTEKNPIVRLKTEMEEKEREQQKETSSLRQKLNSTSKEIKDALRLNQDLKRALALELKRVSVLSRLQEYNREYLAQKRCYEIRNRNQFSISGYFIDFDREKGMDMLQDIIFRNMYGFETTYVNFQKILEDNFLLGQKETLRFRNGIAEHGDYRLRIRGGLTIGSIREFITLKNLPDGLEKNISQEVFKNDVSKIQNITISIPKEGYTEDMGLAYFSVPLFNIGMPILVRETLRVSKEYLPKEKKSLHTEKNSLFYVTAVNAYS